MFVDSVKKKEEKKKRSNRITGFTRYIVRLNSAFSLIGPQKKAYNKHTVSIPMG